MKQMPHSTEAERAVLGAVLRGEKVPALSPDDFYRPEHAHIFKAMLNLELQGAPIQHLSIQLELERLGALQGVGGISFLSELFDGAPFPANIEYYTTQVREKARLRSIFFECSRIAEMALEPSAEAQKVLDQFQAAALGINGEGATGTTLADSLGRITTRIKDASESKPDLLGIPTGLQELDDLTLGWQAPDLIVIGGRPSQGKTALALSLAVTAASTGVNVYFASLEMSADQLTMRALSSKLQTNSRKLMLGRIDDCDWGQIIESGREISQLGITIDDTAAISEMELCRRVRRAKPGLLVVDYLQLMTSARRPERKDLEIANITAGLKGIAKELHIPVILLSQLNREVEKRANGRPMLCDLRESGAIEQDADLVFGLYQDPGTPGTVDLICLKHRNGPLGTVTVAFQGEVCGFKDLQTT